MRSNSSPPCSSSHTITTLVLVSMHSWKPMMCSCFSVSRIWISCASRCRSTFFFSTIFSANTCPLFLHVPSYTLAKFPSPRNFPTVYFLWIRGQRNPFFTPSVGNGAIPSADMLCFVFVLVFVLGKRRKEKKKNNDSSLFFFSCSFFHSQDANTKKKR